MDQGLNTLLGKKRLQLVAVIVPEHEEMPHRLRPIGHVWKSDPVTVGESGAVGCSDPAASGVPLIQDPELCA